MMPSVLDALKTFADAHHCDVAELVRRHSDEHFGTLPVRYRELVARVWLRLPDGWDSHAQWEVIVREIASTVGEQHLAGAQLLESEGGDLQQWLVVLCPSALDQRSDADVMVTIAHELAHVASGLPTDRSVRDTPLCEDRANAIMRWWGFA